jgi:hypothetical protein
VPTLPIAPAPLGCCQRIRVVRAGVDIDGGPSDDDDHRPRRLQGARPVLSHHREGPRWHCRWWAFLRPAGRRRHLRLHHHDSRLPKARRGPQGRRRALPPLRHHDRPRPMSRPRGPSRHQDRRRGARVRLRRPSRSDRGPVHQPVHLGTHDHRSQGHSLARLPRPRGGLRRARMAVTLMDGASVLESYSNSGSGRKRYQNAVPKRRFVARSGNRNYRIAGTDLAGAEGGTRTPGNGFGDGVAEGNPLSTFRLPGSDVGGTIGIASTAWGRHGETVSRGS